MKMIENLDLNELRLFIQVAKLSSITLAANATGEQKSKISRKVRNLEAQLQTRLFYRKPGSMDLSLQGKQLFEIYAPIFEKIEKAQITVVSNQQSLAGVIKIMLPLNLAMSSFIDVLFNFNKIYHDIHLNCSTVIVHPNIPKNDADIMFLLDYVPLPDHFYVAKKLWVMEVGIFCSPKYKARLPNIVSVSQLEKLSCITSEGINGFTFLKDKEDWFVQTNSRIQIDGYLPQKEAALNDLGLFSAPKFLLEHELEEGRLIDITFSLPLKPMSLFIAYEEKGFKAKPVQLFIDYVIEQFQYKDDYQGHL